MTETITIYEPKELVNTGDYAQLEAHTNDAALVELWATWPRQANSKLTSAHYRRAGQRLLQAIGKPLQAITAPDLKAWAEGLDGLDNTRRTAIMIMRSLFSFALKTGYIRVNPAIMIAAPTTKNAIHERTLTQQEVLMLMAHAKPGRDQTLIRCLYSSGARISELVALQWKDVEPTKDGAILHLMGKGGKQRASGISKDTYAALLAVRKPGIDLVFDCDRTTAHRAIKAAAKKAGITKPVSPHWFRHSHASHSIANGASVVAVKDQLGHASLQTTTIYAHSDESSSKYLAV